MPTPVAEYLFLASLFVPALVILVGAILLLTVRLMTHLPAKGHAS